MLDIEQAVAGRFPNFYNKPMLRKPALRVLKALLRQDAVNIFLYKHQALEGCDFIDAIFDYFDFSYSVSLRDRANIPAEGRVVIVANHPIGSLDGLALIKLVSEVRPDVKILANQMLSHFAPLKRFLISVDNFAAVPHARKGIKALMQALSEEQAVIVFPAGEVSRAQPTGVKDGQWKPGFLHIARRASAPVLPICIKAKNSWYFYGASWLFKPFSTILLAQEMFNKQSKTIHFLVGETIHPEQLQSDQLNDRALVKRLRKHLYKIGKGKTSNFITQKTIAHPEPKELLIKELSESERLGATSDGHEIYLVDYQPGSALMRELGRQREIAFRKVGEGTGAKRDLDNFDVYYRHLILWDKNNFTMVGAYRLGEGKQIMANWGEEGFYTRQMYTFADEYRHYLLDGVELGRSFVHPDYWGKASLDYLWQGIGAYLARYPARYLIGPVSMSARYPEALMDILVTYFRVYFQHPKALVQALNSYQASPLREMDFCLRCTNLTAEQAFSVMQKEFQAAGFKIPVLFKQYLALFKPGGFLVMDFTRDKDFGDCLDALCIADLQLIKDEKARRYLHGHSLQRLAH
ncbi:MAG TPA: GNAT family N-acyltransferase [Cellvibrionaceae bacterium]